MRVVHILDSLNRGGAEILALDICRNAKANNLNLTFVTTGGGDLESEFRQSGVEVIRLNRRFPLDPQVILALHKIIKERRIKVLHGYQAVDGLHAYFAALGTSAKVVLSYQGYAPDLKNRLVLRFLTPRTSANIAVSRSFLDLLKTKEGLDTSKNFHVIYNAVDQEKLKSTSGYLRDELGLSQSDILMGMVANFYPDGRKDQLTVCNALPQLFRRVPHAHFLFVGGHQKDAAGPYNACVTYCREQDISDRVHFLGQRRDIPNVLGSLDIFVFSSLADTFGVAVIEAMMAGLPTVVSDIGPLLEVSGNGEYARVFRTGDSADLARVLEELSNNPQDRTQLASRGKNWATQQFSIQEHISNLLHLYKSLAAS